MLSQFWLNAVAILTQCHLQFRSQCHCNSDPMPIAILGPMPPQF
jgi:hypothetical protein